jgi:putative transposase
VKNTTNSLAHTKWNCKYHIVFAPKYRRQVIYGKIKGNIGKIIRKLCEWKQVELIEATACPDHIHILVSIVTLLIVICLIFTACSSGNENPNENHPDDSSVDTTGIPPKLSVSSFMGYLKGKSSLMIFDQHANLKYKYGNREFWCRGYYVDTVGKNKNAIAEYIRNQLQEDLSYEQMTIKELVDPFTGEPSKGSNK